MNVKQQDKLIAHFDKYFGQDNANVFHPDEHIKPHIDVLCYPPNEAYPFWKLVTMGASDYKMPKAAGSLGNRNEYMMFIDMDENLLRNEIWPWYLMQLMDIAMYSRNTKIPVTYGHSMEWAPEEDSDIAGAFLEMPQIVADPGILHCKLSPFKTAICLQAVLLTKPEIDNLLKIGHQAFSDYLYPKENGPSHYLSQKHRSEKF